MTSRTVAIHLMDAFTGHIAICTWKETWTANPTSPYWTSDHALTYYWTQGNLACDCNRFREWIRATQPTLSHQQVDAAEEGNDICGEPRIRARYLEGTEPFDDWPQDEAGRLAMVERIREGRKVLDTDGPVAVRP